MTSDEPTAQPGWRTQDEASAPSVLDQCRVDDDGPAATLPGAARSDARTDGAAGQNLADRWPREPGHGLWLARQVADQMMLRCDSHGTSAVITFSVPAILIPSTPP